MKKTITANLNQVVLTFEEDAYEKLQSYLDSITRHFSKHSDKDEIIGDIEARIAEKLTETHKNVIQLADVLAIISSMGSIKDIDDTDEPETVQKVSKKLFRDSDHVVIAGVASGLAAYLGIDPVIIRLLFIASLFAGGFGVLAYIAFWIAMPEAKTASDKLAMYGEPITLSSIESTITEKQDDPYQEKLLTRMLLLPFRALGSLIRVLSMVFPPVGRLFVFIIGLGIFIGGLFGIGGVIAGNIIMITKAYTPYVEAPIAQFLSSAMIYPLVFGASVVAIIPLIFIILAGVSLIRRKITLNWLGGLTLLFVWIVSIMTLGVMGVKYGPEFQHWVHQWSTIDETNRQSIPVTQFSNINISGIQQAYITRGKEYKVELVGNQYHLDSIEVVTEEDNLAIRIKQPVGHQIRLNDSRRPVIAHITTPVLHSYSSRRGSVHATITGFSSDTLSFDLSGLSHTQVNTVNAKNLLIDMDGMAYASMSGTVDTVTATLKGNTQLDAENLKTKTATVTATDLSMVRLTALTKLDVAADDLAKVSYWGNPKVSTASSSGMISHEQ